MKFKMCSAFLVPTKTMHLLCFQLLVPLVSTYRYEGNEVNMTIAKSEAKILHQKIGEKAYTNDDLIRIFATRSKTQINATLNHYKNESGKDINKMSEKILTLIRYRLQGRQKKLVASD